MRLARLVALGVVGTLAGCGNEGGVAGIVGGPVPEGATSVPVSVPAGLTTTVPGGPSSVPPATGTVPVPAGRTTTAGPVGPSTPAAPAGFQLDGDDLGVTRVGAPFRQAVAAVAAVLGRPPGDPAPDTACVGAEDETTWSSFRLASTAGRLSGWLSTSTSVATPEGVKLGTTLAALRQAYGARLQLPPPAPDSGTIFLVSGAGMAGTLSGPAPSDTVTSISNGTCQAP